MVVPSGSHYEVLGVDPSASPRLIREAYHRQARVWHPDRFSDADADATAEAEQSMRAVNEAWRVLSDVERRRRYDEQLQGVRTVIRPGVTTQDGITRIDPRLLDPDFLAARRREQYMRTERRNVSMLRYLPLVGFVVVVLAIVIFTAYARSPIDIDAAPTTVTFPGPDIGIDAGACVRRLPDAGLLEVPCTGSQDGRLIGVALPDGECPEPTKLEQPVGQGKIACIG